MCCTLTSFNAYMTVSGLICVYVRKYKILSNATKILTINFRTVELIEYYYFSCKSIIHAILLFIINNLLSRYL